jgi:Flp pilus assembly protein TadG
MRDRLRDDSGLIAVMVGVFSVVMFVLAALVVDLGIARETSREAQTAADAAALAGAGELYADDGTLRAAEAIAAVKEYVGANYGTSDSDWSSCSVPLDGWSSSAGAASSGTSCIAFDSATTPKKLRVVVPTRHTAALFGSLLGYTGSDIGAEAQASAVSSAIPPCALCVFGQLTPGSAAVSVTGGGSVHAGVGGELKSDGSLSVAADGTIRYTGSANPPSGPQYSPNPPVTNSGVPVKDRYQAQAMPSTTGLPDSGSDSVACGPGGEPSLTPGRYRDIVIKNITCDLAPGLYVITGKMEMNSADSRLAGNGVTLYFTCGTRQSPSGCGSGSAGGFLEGSRKGVALGSAYFGGFSILYDPGNTSDLVLKAADASDSQSLGGAIYAKSATMRLEHGQVAVTGPVVVGSLDVAGGAMGLSVHAAGLASVPGPPEILLTK